MAKRKPSTPEAPKTNASWTYITEIQVNGRKVVKGTELKIAGQRGRFRFIQQVKTDKAEWVDVWGGPKGSENWRSFSLDKIKRVHYKNQTDASLAVEYKQKMKDKKQEAIDENDNSQRG